MPDPTSPRIPRFAVLLAGMLLELMLAPLLATTLDWVDGARLVTVVVLLAALFAVGLRRVTLVLFIPALIAHLIASRSNASPVVVASAALKLLFFGYVMARIMWHVLHDRSITLDTIAGTACAYMLLGVVWGNLFQLVEQVSPGSFDLPSGWTIGPEKDPRAALMYFSFVTLTTVGYGDIKPASLGAGGLCVTEAIVGQLYLAIMIARMVGLHIAQRTS